MASDPIAQVVSRKNLTPLIDQVTIMCPLCTKKHKHTVEPGMPAHGTRSAHCGDGHYTLSDAKMTDQVSSIMALL